MFICKLLPINIRPSSIKINTKKCLNSSSFGISRRNFSNSVNSTINDRIQYISDIHLEYREEIPLIPKVGNNLALLGDIGNPFKDNYTEFLKYTSVNWDRVFLLAGNHEYWQSQHNYDEVNKKIKEITQQFNNVYFLNNQLYELENYTIIGSTLWSKIDKEPTVRMGDDTCIKMNNKPITFSELNNLHTNSVNCISSQINQNKKPIIVLTHYLPSYDLIIEKYQTKRYKPYYDRFASRLDHLLKDPVKFWICGHSHCNIETQINNVYCGINAFGYPKQSNTKNINSFSKFIDL